MHHGASTCACAHNRQAASSRHDIAPNLWLLNISDFSLVDYRILAMLQEWVCPVRHVDKLRQTDSRLSKQLIGSDLG